MLPLVFLPGMMCDARLYAHQISVLSSHYTLQVATIHDGTSVEEIGHQVLTHAPPRFIVIGLSMGGIIAMELLGQEPERIAGLILLDTNPLADSQEMKEIRDEQMKQVQAGQLRTLMREQMIPRFQLQGADTQKIADTCLSMAMDLGDQPFINQSRALQKRADQQDTLRATTVPTLIACGEHDTVCPLERHYLMHDLVIGSHLEIIEGAGHLPTLEQPEKTTQLVHQWLQQHPGI